MKRGGGLRGRSLVGRLWLGMEQGRSEEAVYMYTNVIDAKRIRKLQNWRKQRRERLPLLF